MSNTVPETPGAEDVMEHIAHLGRALWAATHLGAPAP